jgi:hypothetical protein
MLLSHSLRAGLGRCCRWAMRALTVTLLGTVATIVGLLAGSVSVAAATATGGCSWQTQYGMGGSDLGAPDTDAAYWTTTYLQFPGRGLVISGAFPRARYMSFTLYSNSSLVPGGSLFDAELSPSSGTNPFQANTTGPGDYTVTVVAGAAPADRAPNTLYTGTTALAEFELLYRVYDPLDPPTGGVPLPQISDTIGGQVTTVHGPCVGSTSTTPLAGPGALNVTGGTSTLDAPRNALSASTSPTWAVASWASGFGNPDNAYLQAAINPGGGQLVVLQARMPAFPNTNAGQPSWQSGQQVRYWSICENDGPLMSVVGCVPDFDAVESNGIATFVISSTINRPANATAADGVNWIPWGAFPSGLVMYRQMLAAAAFQQSIADARDAPSLASAMGAYLPTIAYCSKATFAATGAAGCLAGTTQAS